MADDLRASTFHFLFGRIKAVAILLIKCLVHFTQFFRHILVDLLLKIELLFQQEFLLIKFAETTKNLFLRQFVHLENGLAFLNDLFDGILSQFMKFHIFLSYFLFVTFLMKHLA